MAFQRFFFKWSCRNCTCPQKHLQNRFFLKRYHFLNIILRQLSAIFMSRGTIQKNCSKLVTMSLWFSDNGRKRSGSLGDSFRLGCKNCVLCVRVKNLRKTIFGNIKFFYLFPTVNEKLHRFLFNSFVWVDDFAFYESKETFSSKVNFLKNINFAIFSGNRAKNCQPLVKIFLTGLSNLNFTYSWGCLGVNVFLESFYHFRTCSKRVLAFYLFFCKRSSQNCFVRVLKIFFLKKSNWKNQIFLKLWETDWFFFRLYSKLFATGLSKLHSICSEEQFKEKKFTGNYKVFIIFGQWAKKFWLSGKFFAVGLWKLHATCPYEKTEKKTLLEK